MRGLIGLAVITGGSGCLGPRALEQTRLRYDQVVHETSDQQWLRNLVRLRYGESPTFLDVAAVTSQFEVNGGATMTGGRERASPNLSLFGNLSSQFRDAPTLSYVPRAQTELTRAMLAPVGITALGLMANTAWSYESVLRLIVSEANDLPNAPGADRLIPEQVPLDSGFLEIARAAGRLRTSRIVALMPTDHTDVVSAPISEDRVSASDLVAAADKKLEFKPSAKPANVVLTRTDPAYSLAIAPHALGDPDVLNLVQLLHLFPNRSQYGVKRVDRTTADPLQPLGDLNDQISVKTRTILEMMIYLSKGVDVPDEHLCRGLAIQTPGPDGTLFDWTQVTSGLFHVCVQKKRPKEAAVAIEYRGYWYYIADSDHLSKATMTLIQAILNVQLSEPKQSGPILTLPVGL
ncbi:MAG TPA: hypothetical protein VGZ22_08275 [Isosphaeraceae bacterium]|nr:hypothetical protein [Isosphaeraceae bacterium]